ncbi:MAG: hypothetical protein ACW99A_03935 [Candidatus Kariarchaeaceae archaeon]|jgi:hypothetical protein
MNTLTLVGKPHKLPFELFEPYLEIDLEPATQKLEKDISQEIESLDCPVLVAYYDIVVMEREVAENEDSFRDIQSLVD